MRVSMPAALFGMLNPFLSCWSPRMVLSSIVCVCYLSSYGLSWHYYANDTCSIVGDGAESTADAQRRYSKYEIFLCSYSSGKHLLTPENHTWLPIASHSLK